MPLALVTCVKGKPVSTHQAPDRDLRAMDGGAQDVLAKLTLLEQPNVLDGPLGGDGIYIDGRM